MATTSPALTVESTKFEISLRWRFALSFVSNATAAGITVPTKAVSTVTSSCVMEFLRYGASDTPHRGHHRPPALSPIAGAPFAKSGAGLGRVFVQIGSAHA